MVPNAGAAWHCALLSAVCLQRKKLPVKKLAAFLAAGHYKKGGFDLNLMYLIVIF
jgi:hypothetical protein